MKRVISLFLSLVMLFSVVSSVDLSVYANEDEAPEYLTEDQALFFTANFLGKLSKDMASKYVDLLIGNTDYDCREGLHNETEWTMLQTSIRKVQSKWSKILKYMPESVSDSQLAKLGNSAFKYISSTVDIFKNIDYIIDEDENILEQTYHSLDIITDCCSLMGITLGPLGIVISALKGFTATILFLYNAFDNSLQTIAINGYKSQLGTCNLTGEEYPEPPKTYLNGKFEEVESEFVYQECCKVYIRASLKRIAQNMQNDTVTEPINEKGYYGGHTYQVFDESMTWTQAKEYCENFGGHLTTITSKEEQKFISDMVNIEGNKTYYWLGGFVDDNDGMWEWVTGESWSYSNWNDGEPNNYIGFENCLEMYASNKKWNDEEENGENSSLDRLNAHGLICEWDNYINPYPTMNDEHTYAQTVVVPTCTSDGYTINRCSDCGLEYYSDNVSKLGHNYNFSKTVNPTCTTQGYDLYSCSRCSSTEKRNTTNATGHSYSFTKTANPTCTAQGYDLYTCSACNGTEKRNTVAANGHKYTLTKTVAPTCTAQGYDLYTCSICSATEKRNTVSSTGHNYVEKSNTATCTEKGIKTTVCSKCGDTKTTEVSSLGHSYGKVYTAPTCTKEGGYTNTCSRCGDITYDIYSALGHDYGEYIGKDYIEKIRASSISSIPNYYNEFYHTSSSIGSTSKNSLTSTNMAVPNEIRIDKSNMQEIVNYQFAIKGALGARKNCAGIFAYDKTTGRSPEQSAIPYTDKDGNLVNMKYVDYKSNGEWNCGEYIVNDNNIIVDENGNTISNDYSETRPHIVYTREYALENGIMNDDATVNVDFDFLQTSGISFSAGIPKVYFSPDFITSSNNSRKFLDVFNYDENSNSPIKVGKYDVDLCFYNSTYSGLTSTVFKIYDDSLITKTPATKTSDEMITYTCMDCGEQHTDTYKLDLENFKIKTASLSLESSITMNFKVLKSAVSDFENPYIECECNGVKTKLSNYTEQGDYFVFAYKGISPQMLGDEVTATLYAEHNGINYKSESKSLSVKGYIDKLLPSCTDASYAKLRTVLIDLLNYGAAAQIYRNYKTDKLVNADLTDEQKSWGTSLTPTIKNITNKHYETINNPTVQFNSAGLVLNDSVMLRAKFTASSIDNLKIKISCNGREFIYTKDYFEHIGNGTYYVYCNEIYADEMSKNILITAYNGDEKCSNTLLFSIESYAKAVQDNYPNTALKNLTDAMMCYGKSAEAYRK